MLEMQEIIAQQIFSRLLARTPLEKRFLNSKGLSWLNKG